jgi:DnaK suppressor protein
MTAGISIGSQAGFGQAVFGGDSGFDTEKRRFPFILDSVNRLSYSLALKFNALMPAVLLIILEEPMASKKKKFKPKKIDKKASNKKLQAKTKPASKKTIVKAAPARKKVRIAPAFKPLLKKLQDRRNEITGQVTHLEMDLREEIADNQNMPGDMADHGSGELNQHLSVTLMENDRIELERIERAITRMQDGTYGLCEVCEKAIPMSRMKAIPWATRCIGCQSRFEGG